MWGVVFIFKEDRVTQGYNARKVISVVYTSFAYKKNQLNIHSHRKLLCELSTFSKCNAFINFPCITTLGWRTAHETKIFTLNDLNTNSSW